MSESTETINDVLKGRARAEAGRAEAVRQLRDAEAVIARIGGDLERLMDGRRDYERRWGRVWMEPVKGTTGAREGGAE